MSSRQNVRRKNKKKSSDEADGKGYGLLLLIFLVIKERRNQDQHVWRPADERHPVWVGSVTATSVGETLGRFRLIEVIGRGGMGTVYKAQR